MVCIAVHILTEISPQENESHHTASQYVCVSVCVSHGAYLFLSFFSTDIDLPPQKNESHLNPSQYVYVCVSICLCVYLFLSFFSTDIDLPPQEMNHS